MVPQRSPAGNDPLPQSEPIQAPGCRGLVVTSAQNALQPLLEQLPDTRGLQLVKESTVRSVLRGRFDNLDVHVKIHRAVTLSDRARDNLRKDRGAREAANLLAAAALGLQAATPLAHGVYRTDHGARSFLVTRTIEGATPFDFDMDPSVLKDVGRMLRSAHDRGFLPGDLHPGNMVVDRTGLPWLLDLGKVEHHGDPDLRRRAADLAFFCAELDGGPMDPAARSLLFAYLDGDREMPGEIIDELVLATRRLRNRQLGKYGRRSSRPCRHTIVERDGAGTNWRLHQVEDEVERPVLHEACREFLFAPPRPDKEGRRGAVWLGEELVVKRREQGPARHLFEAMYWLSFARVPQPEPVALATRNGVGHVFARRIPAPSLDKALASGRLSGKALLQCAHALGTAVGRLHAFGLRNRDLKFENLVRDPFSGTVCMTDLDGLRRKKAVDRRGQGRDLGRLLAAFRHAGSPGGTAAVTAFARSYLRARQRLLQPAESRRIWRVAGKRAAEWLRAHS